MLKLEGLLAPKFILQYRPKPRRAGLEMSDVASDLEMKDVNQEEEKKHPLIRLMDLTREMDDLIENLILNSNGGDKAKLLTLYELAQIAEDTVLIDWALCVAEARGLEIAGELEWYVKEALKDLTKAYTRIKAGDDVGSNWNLVALAHAGLHAGLRDFITGLGMKGVTFCGPP